MAVSPGPANTIMAFLKGCGGCYCHKLCEPCSRDQGCRISEGIVARVEPDHVILRDGRIFRRPGGSAPRVGERVLVDCRPGLIASKPHKAPRRTGDAGMVPLILPPQARALPVGAPPFGLLTSLGEVRGGYDANLNVFGFKNDTLNTELFGEDYDWLEYYWKASSDMSTINGDGTWTRQFTQVIYNGDKPELRLIAITHPLYEEGSPIVTDLGPTSDAFFSMPSIGRLSLLSVHVGSEGIGDIVYEDWGHEYRRPHLRVTARDIHSSKRGATATAEVKADKVIDEPILRHYGETEREWDTGIYIYHDAAGNACAQILLSDWYDGRPDTHYWVKNDGGNIILSETAFDDGVIYGHGGDSMGWEPTEFGRVNYHALGPGSPWSIKKAVKVTSIRRVKEVVQGEHIRDAYFIYGDFSGVRRHDAYFDVAGGGKRQTEGMTDKVLLQRNLQPEDVAFIKKNGEITLELVPRAFGNSSLEPTRHWITHPNEFDFTTYAPTSVVVTGPGKLVSQPRTDDLSLPRLPDSGGLIVIEPKGIVDIDLRYGNAPPARDGGEAPWRTVLVGIRCAGAGRFEVIGGSGAVRHAFDLPQRQLLQLKDEGRDYAPTQDWRDEYRNPKYRVHNYSDKPMNFYLAQCHLVFMTWRR